MTSVNPPSAIQDPQFPLPIGWAADNRRFVIEDWLPHLCAPPDVLQVIRWAYGYDGEVKSYEHASDGSTGVPDRAMNGLIKEPAGVAHDYLNRCPRHITPDGHRWTMLETCAWYRRALIVFGYHPAHARLRQLGLVISSPCWWRR